MNAQDELIKYRREKAKETLRDAGILLKAGSSYSAVNRIYYAMFYEVVALLLTQELSSVKHSGVRALFNEHFVKTGKADTELGRFYSRMFDFRQKSDYGDFVVFEEDKVKEWLNKAEQFIESLEGIIEKGSGDETQLK